MIDSESWNSSSWIKQPCHGMITVTDTPMVLCDGLLSVEVSCEMYAWLSVDLDLLLSREVAILVQRILAQRKSFLYSDA